MTSSFRVGVIPHKIKVFNDDGRHASAYTIHAQTSLDARCIAFVLDGGSERVEHWDDGHIELALTWTAVIE